MTSAAPTEAQLGPARDVGVDLVRGLAIVAMIVAHVKSWWPVDSGVLQTVLNQVNDVASPLFCLVMGVAAGLVLVRTQRPVLPAAFVARNLVRGLALIWIGLLIEQLPTHIAIVLQVLGVVLIVGSPLALLPTSGMLVLAAAVFLVGPHLNEVAREAFSARVGGAAPFDRVLEWVVLSPTYRLTNLLPFFLVGAFLGRTGLRHRDLLVVLGLAAGALVVLVAGPDSRDLTSGTLLDNVSDLWLSFTALGVTLLGSRADALRPVLHALVPVTAVGGLALTAYVVHVVLIAGLFRFAGWETMQGMWWQTSGAVLVLTVGGGWLWQRLLGRGPIERLLALVTDRIR